MSERDQQSNDKESDALALADEIENVGHGLTMVGYSAEGARVLTDEDDALIIAALRAYGTPRSAGTRTLPLAVCLTCKATWPANFTFVWPKCQACDTGEHVVVDRRKTPQSESERRYTTDRSATRG